MSIFSVHEAKTKLSQLLEAAERGEEVVIARGRIPVARLVPVKVSRPKLGFLRDALPADEAARLAAAMPDFLAPSSEAELADWE